MHSTARGAFSSFCCGEVVSWQVDFECASGMPLLDFCEKKTGTFDTLFLSPTINHHFDKQSLHLDACSTVVPSVFS